MQAKPLIETGNSKGLLDPDVTEIFDESQFQRMVLAASHCLTRSATHRPNIRQVRFLFPSPRKLSHSSRTNLFFVSSDTEATKR